MDSKPHFDGHMKATLRDIFIEELATCYIDFQTLSDHLPLYFVSFSPTRWGLNFYLDISKKIRAYTAIRLLLKLTDGIEMAVSHHAG